MERHLCHQNGGRSAFARKVSGLRRMVGFQLRVKLTTEILTGKLMMRKFVQRHQVRFGSETGICSAKTPVRFTPESGRSRCKRRCPLRPKADIGQLYSI